MKMVNYLTICIVLASSLYVSSDGKQQDVKLPSYIDVCYRNDPKVAECIKHVIEKLVPIFKSGSTDFELAPLDPLEFVDLVFKYESSVLGGALTIPKVILEGIKDVKVLKVRPNVNNPSKLAVEFDVFFPQITTYANYTLKGNVLTANVDIGGRLDIQYVNITVTYRLDADVKPKNKVNYLMLKSFRWRFFGDSIEQLNLLNDNVVEGKPVLNGVVRGLIRNAWRPLMNQMLPAILARTDISLTQMFKKFFTKFPYDVLFPKQKT